MKTNRMLSDSCQHTIAKDMYMAWTFKPGTTLTEDMQYKAIKNFQENMQYKAISSAVWSDDKLADKALKCALHETPVPGGLFN